MLSGYIENFLYMLKVACGWLQVCRICILGGEDRISFPFHICAHMRQYLEVNYEKKSLCCDNDVSDALFLPVDGILRI